MSETSATSSLWFVRLPRKAMRISRSLAYLLADGHFLIARPPLASVLPVMALLLGVVFGGSTLGYDRVFTESLVVLVVACGLGYLSTNLGIAFVVGFALGDFFIGETVWNASLYGNRTASDGVLASLVRVRAPMLIGYLLLFILVVWIPRLLRALIADIPPALRLPKGPAFAAASLINIVLVAVVVRFWAEAAALLVRPLFTWQFQEPTVAAIYPLQQQGRWIVLAALVGTIVRFGLLWSAYASEQSTRRILAAEADLAEAVPKEPAVDRFGRVPKAVVAAAVSTAALSGLFDGWSLPLIAFVTFLVLHLIRQGVLPPRLERWRQLAARIPILIRIITGLLLLSNVGRNFASERDPDFTRLAVYLLVSVVVLFVLLPGSPQQRRASGSGSKP